MFRTINGILLVFLLVSCGKSTDVKPVVQDIKELVFASGELEWDDAYNLTAQTDGVLRAASFDVGTVVAKGTLLGSIDNENNKINSQVAAGQLVIANENTTAQAPQLQQLEQQIGYAAQKYKQDQQQAERYERLYGSQSVAKVEYENAQLMAQNALSNWNALREQKKQLLQQAKQQQLSARGQFDNNKVYEQYNQLVVSESGRVVKKLKTTGDFVRKGDVVAVIANDKKIEGVLHVDENNIGKMQLGQLVFVQLNTNKSKVYKGKIAEILAAYDEKSQSFICKVLFDEVLPSTLFGTQLEANVLVGEKKRAMLIPREYVGFGNKVSVKGRDQNVIIKTGIVSSDYVEVLEGIGPDDVLIPLKP